MPTISIADPSVYTNDASKPTDGAKVLVDLNAIVAETNLKETRIANIESAAITLTGLKSFSNGIDVTNGATVDFLRFDGTVPGVPVNGDVWQNQTTWLTYLYNNGSSVALDGNPVNAQTGTTYTFVKGDRGKIVTFSNAAAIAVTLPQATTSGFEAGWPVYAVNRGAGTVTITPTTSTIDGDATMTLDTNQGVQIFSDGGNYVTNRGRSIFSKTPYDSGDQTITLAALLTLPHGFGIKPKLVQAYWKNVTTDAGWVTGDEIDASSGLMVPSNATTIASGAVVYSDTTNVYVRYGATAPMILNKTTGGYANMTIANWVLVIRAYA